VCSDVLRGRGGGRDAYGMESVVGIDGGECSALRTGPPKLAAELATVAGDL